MMQTLIALQLYLSYTNDAPTLTRMELSLFLPSYQPKLV